MKSIFAALALCAALTGCQQPPLAHPMNTDARTGTASSPYRSMATAIQCTDCRMPSER